MSKPVEQVLTKTIAGMEKSEVLEGEESLINIDAKCQAHHMIYKGRLIVTTYQVAFVPAEPKVFKRRNILPDFFRIPHGTISRYCYYVKEVIIIIHIIASRK